MDQSDAGSVGIFSRWTNHMLYTTTLLANCETNALKRVPGASVVMALSAEGCAGGEGTTSM
eukprot:2710376-Pyramimonas_sp.AAC.1